MNKKCPLCGDSGVFLPSMTLCRCRHGFDIDEMKRGLFSQLQQWRLVQVFRSLMWWVPK